jgi:hypothetical protein
VHLRPLSIRQQQAPRKTGELLHLDTFCDREIIAVALVERSCVLGSRSVDKCAVQHSFHAGAQYSQATANDEKYVSKQFQLAKEAPIEFELNRHRSTCQSLYDQP